MDRILDIVDVYERLRKNKYRITVEDGSSFVLELRKGALHHLAGFHYLTDLPLIAYPSYGMERFYSDIKKGRLDIESARSSVHYNEISERIDSFATIEEILSPKECDVIVDFDRSICGSSIVAKYYLYKRTGSVINGDVIYNNLFLGYDEAKASYYPATYLVEHSNKYIKEQNILSCKITFE